MAKPQSLSTTGTKELLPSIRELADTDSPDQPKVEHRFATLKNLKLHYVIAGKGPLVVLLHGMAGTWYTWRRVIPKLAEHYTVLAPDLRGFGDSDKPETGYDKKSMACDIQALLDQLGYKSCLLAGHDFGGPIGYALAAAHRATVRRLAVFESLVLLPTETVNVPPWFVTFFQQPAIPEILLKGKEREFLKTWMNQLTTNKSALSEEDFDEYGRTFSMPGGVLAGAGLYRSFPTDLEDNRASAKNKLTIPVMAFGAENGMRENTLSSFKSVAENPVGGVVADCGHFVPEERPDFVVGQLLTFFREDSGS